MVNKAEKKSIMNLFLNNKLFVPICFCFALLISLLISFYAIGFLYVAVVIALVYVFFFIDERACYVIFYLIPLINIFSIKNGGFNLLAIVFAALTAKILCMYVYKLIKKQIKINWFNLVCTLLLCLYIFGFSFAALSRKFGLICGILFLFSMQIFTGKIKLKKIAIFFLLGLITAVLFGILKPTSTRLESLIVNYSANGLRRFAGVSNPNFIVGELALCFAVFSYLFVNKEIGRIYYLIVAFLQAIAFLTISKSGLIVFSVVIILTLIFMLIKFKGKEKLETLFLILVILVVALCCFKYVSVIFNRYTTTNDGAGAVVSSTSSEYVSKSILGSKLASYEKAFYSNKFCLLLNKVTTGRFTLWLQFVIGTCSTFKSFLFGFGMASEDAVAVYNGEYLSAHNAFVQYFYYFGFIGIVLALLILISILKKDKLKKFNILALIPLLALMLFMFYDSLISYRLCIFIYIVWNAMFCNKKTENGEASHDKSKQVNSDSYANLE